MAATTIDPELEKMLDRAAHKAMTRLFEIGCDPKIINFQLLTLNRDRTPRGMSIHPLDSIESATAGMTLDDLRHVQRRARRLKTEVLKLQKTAFVRHMIALKSIGTGDLLRDCKTDTDPFDGLLKLPTLAKNMIGAKKYPDRTRLLTMILRYVREHTQTWNEADGLLTPILICTIPPGVILNTPARPMTRKALYQWRKRHSITD
jgi:hypothetical protein